MLEAIGAAAIDELFRDVPDGLLLDGPIAGLPPHASEMAVERHMAMLAAKNLSAGEVPFFLGAGAYRHHVPASVDHLIQRGEFLTSYTPYQPEIAQGKVACQSSYLNTYEHPRFCRSSGVSGQFPDYGDVIDVDGHCQRVSPG